MTWDSIVPSEVFFSKSSCIFLALENTRSEKAQEVGAAKNCLVIFARCGNFGELSLHQRRISWSLPEISCIWNFGILKYTFTLLRTYELVYVRIRPFLYTVLSHCWVKHGWFLYHLVINSEFMCWNISLYNVMYMIYYVHMFWLLNEHNLCTLLILWWKTMVIIVDITQVVHKGTNYLNKTIGVCQYNLVYSGYV